MRVAFINENTLGHASYLVPFARELNARKELNVTAQLVNATPLPPELERRANFSIRGLRKWGLDFSAARWRMAVSRHVRQQLEELRRQQTIHAVVVNTQSVGLKLAELAASLPVLVCLDATFEQLASSLWFAPNAPSRWFLPLTLASIRKRERRLFQRATRLLPWSAAAGESLRRDYGLPMEKISQLPPSLPTVEFRRADKPLGHKRQILFVGGDFRRKGGAMLLKSFRTHFAATCELHIVTQSPVPTEPGVFVHCGLAAHSAAWRERWEQADVFVFPSTLETFGIVLLEALAFGVPVVSTDVGAAREVLDGGRAGVILSQTDEAALTAAINETLQGGGAVQARVQAGRELIALRYNLENNTAQLAEWLRAAASSKE